MSLTNPGAARVRINIISKAKLRYEGFLHSIESENPNYPVITLSDVRSFGTEDRLCDRPINPRDVMYDKIVFKGDQIEDIYILNSVADDDPIISFFTDKSPTSSSLLPEKDNSGKHQGRQNHSSPDQWPSESSLGSNRADKQTSSLVISEGGDANVSGGTSSSIFNIPGLGRPFIGGSHNEQIATSASSPKNLNQRESSRVELDVLQMLDKRDSNKRLPAANVNNQRPNYPILTPQSDGSSFHKHDQNQRGWDGTSLSYPNFTSNNRSGFGSHNSGFAVLSQESARGRRGLHNRGANTGGSYNRRAPRGVPEWGRHTGVPTAVGDKRSCFSDEYDIERANAELAAELEKMNLGSSSVDSNTADVGDNSINEELKNPFDQEESFYDLLSSDMLDRANGVLKRGNRRDERRLNSDTFGTTAANRGRDHLRLRNQRGRGAPAAYTGYNSPNPPRRGGRGFTSGGWRSSGAGDSDCVQKPKRAYPIPIARAS